MLTASTNLMQEEWVKRWLHKLTPKQKALVTEVLEDCHKYRNPTQAAVEQADTAVGLTVAACERLSGCTPVDTGMLFSDEGIRCHYIRKN